MSRVGDTIEDQDREMYERDCERERRHGRRWLMRRPEKRKRLPPRVETPEAQERARRTGRCRHFYDPLTCVKCRKEGK